MVKGAALFLQQGNSPQGPRSLPHPHKHAGKWLHGETGFLLGCRNNLGQTCIVKKKNLKCPNCLVCKKTIYFIFHSLGATEEELGHGRVGNQPGGWTGTAWYCVVGSVASDFSSCQQFCRPGRHPSRENFVLLCLCIIG